jgi:hypothetical protein
MRTASRATFALAAVLTAGAAVAEPGRVTYATETSPGGPTRMLQLPGSEAVMVFYAAEAWIWQPSKLSILRRHADPDAFETVSTDHLHTERAVAVRKAADGKTSTLRDAVSNAVIATIGADETLLMVADAYAGDVMVTRRGGEWDEASQGNATASLLLYKTGGGAPYKTLELPMRGAKTSTISTALSADGKMLGVTANGRGWVVDLASGQERRIALPDATRVENMAFTPDSRRIIVGIESDGFIVVDAATLKRVGDVKTPRMARKMKMIARAGGRVLEVQGRRERALIDVASGKHVLAQRISSGHAFQLDWAGPDLVVRASRPRLAKKTTYGVYRHAGGDFKQLYRVERDKLTLAGVAQSPNGACLFIGSPTTTAIHDLVTDKPLVTVGGLKRPFEEALFTQDGERVFGVDADGRAASIETPRRCHGTAPR